MFFLFLLKNRLWVHDRTASVSTHNLCFRAKIKENVYPVTPKFYYIKEGCKDFHGRVSMMENRNSSTALERSVSFVLLTRWHSNYLMNHHGLKAEIAV